MFNISDFEQQEVLQELLCPDDIDNPQGCSIVGNETLESLEINLESELAGLEEDSL